MNTIFVALFVAILAYTAMAGTLMRDGLNTTSNCNGNCPGGACPSCPCGTDPYYVDVASWCAQYSWNQAACQCIISHESGGNAHAVNYNSYQSASYLWDVGLWQINSFNWNACSGGAAPCDPGSSLNCAIDVYRWGGNTWKLWSTCGACGVCGSN